ncbi:hypothetical protein BH11PSE11_BH11PSE11_19370 [soil metagenome]
MKTICKLMLCMAIAWLPMAASSQASSNAPSLFPIGDWKVNKSLQGMYIAATSNDSGAVAGILCGIDSQRCDAYISVESTACERGQTYPMMLNSSIGTFAITTKCVVIGDASFQFVNEFAAARQAFESGGEIGFALPLKNGQFNVVGFSTAGATAAIREAMNLPAGQMKKSSILNET